jgi:hypothetical protein
MASGAAHRRQRRAELIVECNRRLGLPYSELETRELRELQRLLNQCSHESLLQAEQAREMLDPLEMQRVHEFVSGSPSERTLLAGRVSTHVFLHCFVVWSGVDNQALLRNGRTLQQVTKAIASYGGMEGAVERVPWLQAAALLVQSFSFDALERHRLFVRHATPMEAISVGESCPRGSPAVSIEEGQHRAIAAAWILTDGGLLPPRPQQIPYLRGVNRRGMPDGEGFWRLEPKTVGGHDDPPHPTTELCCGAVGLLCVWQSLRWVWRQAAGRHRIRSVQACAK